MLAYDFGLLDGDAMVFGMYFEQCFDHGTSFGCALVDSMIGSCNL